jgi:hypothetical protein
MLREGTIRLATASTSSINVKNIIGNAKRLGQCWGIYSFGLRINGQLRFVGYYVLKAIVMNKLNIGIQQHVLRRKTIDVSEVYSVTAPGSYRKRRKKPT